ncbi:MAG: hypothetical protein J1F43_04580 [Muribaculaceae bacterium]|nr:hypothetical protein [Muribaculaceae bacterium]
MSKAKLKKYLQNLSKEEVIDILLQLYDATDQAKSWLEFYLQPNVHLELDRAKKLIYSQFYTRKDYPKDPSFRECNKIISDFKKKVTDPVAIADLMLYYIELGCEQIVEFGDFYENFYISLENNFKKAAQFIASNGLILQFNGRIIKMLESVDGTGWGFSDTLWQFYEDYIGEY